jgi:pyruvate ferredoxin oxidoreductase beta subunit
MIPLGPGYIHVFAPCPTGRGATTEISLELARDVVDCGLWFLAEFEEHRFRLNRDPEEFASIEHYLKKQGRFAHLLPEDIANITHDRDAHWARIRRDWKEDQGSH